MALCVVTIHCPFFRNFDNHIFVLFVNIIIRQAVPYFFAVSSFFLFRNLSSDNSLFYQKVKRYWKHILTLYLIWGGIYLLHDIYFNGFSISRAIHNFISGNHHHLWYLWVLLIQIPVISFFLPQRKDNINQRILIGIILGIILFACNKLCGISSNVNNYFCFWGICDSLVYLFIGISYSVTQKWKEIPLSIYVLFLFFGIIYSFFDNGEFSFGCIIICFTLFPILLKWRIEKKRYIYPLFRQMSTAIYLIHIIILDYISLLGYKGFSLWLITIVLCVIMSFVWIWIKDKLIL